MGERIESYKDLRVYQNVMEATMEVFRLSKSFPPPIRCCSTLSL